jgi:hypothetical protein
MTSFLFTLGITNLSLYKQKVNKAEELTYLSTYPFGWVACQYC